MFLCVFFFFFFLYFNYYFFFFFQAEDGIRDADVTGVQTCALPISITDPSTDRVLGATGITATPNQPGRGEIGYWVAPWARDRGVATAGCVALTEAAFANEHVRLRLLTDPENGSSQRVAIAAGYWREGLIREAATDRRGRRWDMVQWARLASDPSGPSRRLLPDMPRSGITDGVVTLRPLR